MEWFIAVVAVAALGVAAMAAAGGMGQMSKEPVYDTYRQDLPSGGALTAEELKNIRSGSRCVATRWPRLTICSTGALEIAERDALIAELAEAPPSGSDCRSQRHRRVRQSSQHHRSDRASGHLRTARASSISS